jgi:GNAT superfamily N-acetyltransferase
MDPESPGGGAEVAFTVEEDYQRLGIAGSLIRHLIRLARPAGFTRLEADVLSHNLPMLAVFKRSGLPITVRNEGAVVHVMLSLSPSPE